MKEMRPRAAAFCSCCGKGTVPPRQEQPRSKSISSSTTTTAPPKDQSPKPKSI